MLHVAFLGRLDVLVNNAAILPPRQLLGVAPRFRAVFEVTLTRLQGVNELVNVSMGEGIHSHPYPPCVLTR